MRSPTPERSEDFLRPEEVLGQLVRPNDSIVLEIYQGRFRGVISARFKSYAPELLLTTYPTYDGHPVPLRRESEVQVTATTERGLAVVDGVIDHVRKETEPILAIRIPTDTEILLTRQRRFVRAETALPFQYSQRTQGQWDAPTSAVTMDLSGNGLRFLADREIKTGTRLQVQFSLPDQNPMRIVGKAVRSSRQPGGLCSTSVAFIEIPLADQDAIVHHIFQLERAEGDPRDLLLS